ncbi:TIR domain-containing protein [Caulobacter sp. RL271]|jgi:tetratricopeptide (TPR) repeat protein|uniref:TIR domain-containing protein n=1 Tax=Caulobacter segnis TaxID=88688 RepID=A0ABY4ZWQ8_9CAUL|nr:TIR domain-containing protein [Caulobacter segnis]USQ96599.1 TIR domain-containing protein [Caulobacter segnis]
MEKRRRYKAFISYSHHDRKAAEWLHRALETYRAPPRLTAGGNASFAGGLRPIFRDRAELGAAADLGDAIRDALDRSDALIVLCSPTAADSRWVDQEVAYFLKDHGPGAVICVITPATPQSARLPEVMPPTLRAALPETVEPLAVDLRPGADGKRLARLKIAAGLLGVSLDQLVQRDARRRLRVMTAFTTLAALVTVGMGAMTIATLKSRQIAREQRDETEALVAYMLGDLRQQLEPVGRLDVLDGVSAKVLAYYAKARTDRLDDKALAQRAKAQTLLGTIREQRNDLVGAEDAFRQAAATTHALVERDPKNGERIFDEAQNVFWLAYMQWRRGDIAGAERGFRRYGELARTLVKLDPKRGEWRIEVAYAQNNLGTLMFEQGRSEEALTAFRSALAVFDAERRRAPRDKALITSTANTRAWIADTLLKQGRVSDAYVERQAALGLLAEAGRQAPDDKRLAAQTIGASLALARLELDLGRLEDARARSDEGMSRLRDLAALDPTNAKWREFQLVGHMDLADIACWSGDMAQARAAHAAAALALAKLRAGEGDKAWRGELDGRLDQQAVVLARRGGDTAGARALAQAIIDRLRTMPSDRDGAADRSLLLGFAQLEAGHADEAVAILAPLRTSLSPAYANVLARAYLATGQRDQGESIVRALKKHGYAHPSLTAF